MADIFKALATSLAVNPKQELEAMLTVVLEYLIGLTRFDEVPVFRLRVSDCSC